MTTGWTEDLCQAFSWPHCKEPAFNERRLLLRQRLEACVKEAWPTIHATCLVRPSLSHPHQFNHFQVKSLKINCGRRQQECKSLISMLGREFKDAIVSPSRSAHIEARLDETGLSCLLRIPAEAWWDFQPLLDELEQSGSALHDKLASDWPSARVQTNDWPGSETLRELDTQQWSCVLKALKPGEHDFMLQLSHGFKEDPVTFLAEQEQPLLSVFKALQWNASQTI